MQRTAQYGNNVDVLSHYPTHAQFFESAYTPESEQWQRSTGNTDHLNSSSARCELPVVSPIFNHLNMIDIPINHARGLGMTFIDRG